MKILKSALTIAGSDPTGGAGMQQDLRVFQSFGVHGLAVPTALTLQDTAKVHRSLPVFPSVVLDQLRVLLRDVTPHAIKLGMLATDDVVRHVALALSGFETLPPLVIDPILRASSGQLLLEQRAWPALIELFSSACLVTPNLPEAEALTGRDVSTPDGVESAARCFLEEFGCAAVLIKGGHREDSADDLFAEKTDDTVELHWLRGTRLPGPPVHGTGCALSAAITASLAQGASLSDAVEHGRRFVADAIARALPLGSGRVLVFH